MSQAEPKRIRYGSLLGERRKGKGRFRRSRKSQRTATRKKKKDESVIRLNKCYTKRYAVN